MFLSIKKVLIFSFVASLTLVSCKKDKDQIFEETGPKLIMKFKFDSTQVRLNNIGQESTMPSQHRSQSPKFNKMAAHYIELAQGDLTPLGSGQILYHAEETNAGGATAIDYSKTIQ